jgi:shikimate dehydrogenase
MRRIVVIGYPSSQSISPAFQQAALDHLDLDARYEAWETPPQRLAEAVTATRAPDCLGANVTVPHKEAAIPLVDEVDALSRQVGAINTIVSSQGSLAGHNTDVIGFTRALREDGGFDPPGCRALVLGAGGAARAVVLALARENATAVAVANRTLARASQLVTDLRAHTEGTDLSALPCTPASLATAVPGWQLLVNCTSVGMAGTPEEKDSPMPTELIPGGILVVDLVYNPAETKLLRAARKRGARTLGGLPMLVHQGAASFELWTGREAPLGIMFRAAREALGLTSSTRDG